MLTRIKNKIRSKSPRSDDAVVIGILAAIATIVIGTPIAWMTHIITCLATGQWGFLIAGAFMFPIGIIHGVMIWFGYGY